MRWVFYALLIINLAYGGWKAVALVMQPTSQAKIEASQPVEPDAPVKLKVVAAAAVPAVVPVARKPSNLCTSLGPWPDAAAANSALAALGDLGANARLVPLTVQKQGLNWVYLPPFASREEALKALKDLQRRGVDSFITNDGETGNAISLGFFGSHDSALGLQQRIKQLGYDAQVRETPKDLTEYWLYLPAAAPDALQSFLEQHPEQVTGRVSCQPPVAEQAAAPSP